jgi:hypothetical protein
VAKKIDPKAKAKRQKIYAGVGGVILVAVLAFQVPRTMKMLNPPGEASASTPSSPTASSSSPIAAPSLSGGNATSGASASGGDGLVDSDALPAPQSGQLLAFGLFRTKDPFVQQINLGGTTGAAAAPGPAGTTSPAGTNGAAGTKPLAPSTTGGSNGGGSAPASTPPPAAATTAEISVNGVAQTVQVGGVFPSSDPFFKLVALTPKSAKISIAGGSLANGAATVMLTKAKPLTLQNTSDGTRYVLRLLSVS